MSKKPFTEFLTGECGTAMIEYALIVALFAVVCLMGVARVGTESEKTFKGVGKEIKAALGENPGEAGPGGPGGPPPGG